MLSLSRGIIPGLPDHVTQRGVRRRDVFFSDEDRLRHPGEISDGPRDLGGEAMKKALVPARILTAAVLATGAAARAADFCKGPYLEFPVDNGGSEMTVFWQANGEARTSKVEWGETAKYGKTSGDLKPLKIVNIPKYIARAPLYRHVIKGLKPATLYHYCVTLDGKKARGSFRTAPKTTATKVTFYAYGDTRTNPADHNKVTGAILADIRKKPDRRHTLLLNAGDIAGNNSEGRYHENHFNRGQKNNLELMAMMPYSGCGGNKEVKTKWGDGFRNYYPRMARGNVGFDYGPVHISSPWREKPKGWMMKDLAASRKPWKVIIHHYPVFTDGSKRGGSGDRKYADMLAKNNINVHIAAHSHVYARAVVSGVTFITTGGGGAPRHRLGKKNKGVVKSASELHFVRFDIDGDVMTITAIKHDGSIIDTAKITKGSTRR